MQSPGSSNADRGTSWGGDADWYADHLLSGDTYHAQVIVPNLARVLALAPGMRVLDLGCGEGFITRALQESGAELTGSDIAPELIALANAHPSKGSTTYHASPAQALTWAKDDYFDVVMCVLALQNMEDIVAVMREVARVLKRGGRFVFVLNHPVVRIPKRSSWGFDEKTGIQYRRLDGYYVPARNKMFMHPGRDSSYTWSFHRSLEEHCKALFKAGFVIVGLEEWLSHKVSERGPRQEAEDTARKEFPLFMMIQASKAGIV